MNDQNEIGDPDYQIPATAKEQKRIRHEHEKTQMVLKIKDIIKKEFEWELTFREKQMELIQQRINKAAKTLHLLRYCLITAYYNKAELQINNIQDELPSFDSQSRIHPALRKLLSTSSGNIYDNVGLRKKNRVVKNTEFSNQVTYDNIEQPINNESDHDTAQLSNKTVSPKNTTIIRNRKLYKHQILVGNISKFAPSESTEDNSTHKWMVYVRGPKEFPDISHIVEKVVFYLHPSYKPNDVIEICKSPFHLSRRGWGEFPLRIQLFFHGKLNKPVDIIHNLKLDRTYTGRQTLGNETLVEVSLYDINKTEGQVRKNGFTVAPISPSKYIENSTIPKPETTIKEIKTEEPEPTVDTRNSIQLDHTYCQTNQYEQNESAHSSLNIEQFTTETNSNGQVFVIKKRKLSEHSVLLNSSTNKRIKTEIIEDDENETIDINKYIINVNLFRLKSVDQTLKVLFKKLPLISELAAHSNYKCLYPFTATSAMEFSSWNTAKQYSSEKPIPTRPENDPYLKYEQFFLAPNSKSVVKDFGSVFADVSATYFALIIVTTAVNILLKLYINVTPHVMAKFTDKHIERIPILMDNKFDTPTHPNIMWARARFIWKLLHTSQSGQCELLTTKKILLYGRIYGYTPITKYSIYKSIRGLDVDFNLSDQYQSKIVNQQLPAHEDVHVNIMDCDVENVRKEESLLVTWTDNFKHERSFVKQAALDVGVMLKKDQIVPGVMYNTSERILFECVKSFAEDLIRQSLAKASEDESFNEGSVLNPTHIIEGLHHRAEFEKILTFNKDSSQY